MAINPATQYPGKIDTSDPDGYPYGKAQNVAVSGDGLGTPWEKALINDLFGLGQALLSEAGITPTGTPDKVGASQYLDAILSLKRKNYIVNPAGAISQENGDGPNVVTGGVLFYQIDELQTSYSPSTGGTVATTRAINPLGFYDVEVEVITAHTVAGSDNVQPFKTTIEAGSIRHLNGKSATYSALITTNFAGTLPIAFIKTGGTIKSYLTEVEVVPGENLVSATVPFESDTIDPSIADNEAGLIVTVATCNEGTTQTGTTDSWVAGGFNSTTGSTQWAKVGGNTVALSRRKLEEGTVPSAFEPNDYGDDLAQCQRYWRKSYNQGDLPATVTDSGQVTFTLNGVTAEQASVQFGSFMRATPVVTPYNPDTGAAGGASREFGVQACSASAVKVGEYGFAISIDSNRVDQNRYSFHYVANARL